MQIKSLRIKSYRSWAISDTASEAAIARIKKLELYAELKSAGYTTALCLKTIGCSKATYYRWLGRYRRRGWRGLESQSRRPKRVRGRQWTAQQEQQVLHLRSLSSHRVCCLRKPIAVRPAGTPKTSCPTLSNKRRSKSARYRLMAAVSFGMSLSKPARLWTCRYCVAT